MNSLSQSTTIDESSLAWRIFSAFVHNHQISLTEDELCAFARNDLKITEDKVTSGFMEYLPAVLIYHMNTWSGWQFRSDLLAGKVPKEFYFDRFRMYLVHKVERVCRSVFVAVKKSLEEQKDVTKKGSKLSSTAIHIECPADMLNNIAFSNLDDDVLMKAHLSPAWQDLFVTQLLNWPFIEVCFQTPDICFVRRQATEFFGYLSFLPHNVNDFNSNFIEYAEVLPNAQHLRLCYSYDYLEKYKNVYLEILRKHRKIPTTKVEEVEACLIQFLADVKHINVNNSIATNTTILFRLSSTHFMRHKKLMAKPSDIDKEKDEERVGYSEVITPKIQLTLHYFRAKQTDSPHLSFEYTDKVKTSNDHHNAILPYISYRCTFCNVKIDLPNARNLMLLHLQNQHRMEHHVRCARCKKQFDVLNLAFSRWKHKCSPPVPSESQ